MLVSHSRKANCLTHVRKSEKKLPACALFKCIYIFLKVQEMVSVRASFSLICVGLTKLFVCIDMCGGRVCPREQI